MQSQSIGVVVAGLGKIDSNDQHGLLHRDYDRPAIMWSNGDRDWLQHGRLHREGGRPVMILHDPNGILHEEWWVNGERLNW